jgi:broad specificity phosphatase PhoE
LNTIYLVRHGENKANITKEFSYKKVDYPLTAKGIIQAQQTAEYFKDKDIHEIYSSPLRRAMETAEIIASAIGLKVVVMENFREVNVGALEGQPPDAANWAIHNRVIADWYSNHRLETTFPDGENYIQVLSRMRDGVQRIVRNKSGKNIVIVAHGGIITATMRDICQNGDNIGELLRQENHNCSITEVELAGINERLEGVLKSWASHSHLHGPAAELVTGSLKFK